MSLIKFNSPSQSKNGLLPGLNNVFDSIFDDAFLTDRMMSRVPAANISESADHFHVELAVPGINKDDFKIKLERNILTISAAQSAHTNDEQKNYTKREYSYSSFVRSFTLPESADENAIDAKYTDGVLTIDIPKREEAKSTSRQIEIK